MYEKTETQQKHTHSQSLREAWKNLGTKLIEIRHTLL